MKKLLFLAVTLCMLYACDRDDLNGSGNTPDKNVAPPRFYGWMTLDDSAPETRGVANSSKVWSRPIAEKNLTVKFLNGTERYQEFVKEVAHEWEKYANVRFRFVPDDQDALVRVGFDYGNKYMSSSWALTGTDHLQQYGNQDEATVHFAQWRRASDAAKRSDVLRAFGQVLGLELEFRHPSFYPAWITDEDGNIDEETIREYWEDELNELISWEELKKVVLDPLNVPAFLLEKTEYYDQNSVMSWPFYEMIAQNIPVIEFDEDYRTELSAQDKEFIKQLYGEPEEDPIYYVRLVEFDYTGTRIELSLEVTENVFVIWDGDKEEILKDEVTYVEPVEGKILETQKVEHTYADNKKHKVIIAQLHAYGQTPTESSALKTFDLTTGVGMENLDLRPEVPNVNLSCVRVEGGTGFTAQQFDFTGNDYLKELYLSEIGNSKVTIDNCPNLEIFATAPSFAAIDLLNLEYSNAEPEVDTLSDDEDEDGPILSLVFNKPDLNVSLEDFSIPPFQLKDSTIFIKRKIFPWPQDPQQNYSLSDEGGAGLSILNCPKLKKLGLEHTRIQNFNFANLPNLESVYLSSESEYLVGCGTPEGNNLRVALNTLKDRTSMSTGQVIIRGMKYKLEFQSSGYRYTAVTFDPYYINLTVTRKNWAICWDPKMNISEIFQPLL